MEKCSVIRLSSSWSLLLAAAGIACQVYDPNLAQEDDSASHTNRAVLAPTDASAPLADQDAALDEAPVLRTIGHCGNGVVDANELCDVAIAQGNQGACPQGCSGQDSCERHTLIGRGCEAHCEDVPIRAAIPDDGCCPEGASPDSDSDCAATCGNGVREAGERCDPPETCVSEADCMSHDACVAAHYSGDAAHCNASCTLTPVQACVGGDGCCPAGCTAEHDSDCSPAVAPPRCTENCDSPAPASDCQKAHSGGSCEACDCEHCQNETLHCTADTPATSAACAAVAHCAAQNHCSGIDCYCGALLDANRCQMWPLGPCVKELRSAAGGGNVYQMLVLGLLGTGPIGHASALLNCRKSKCASECGLRAPD
jgi:hypothetical protein